MNVENKTRIETIIEFPFKIPCKVEVLGAEFQIKIGSHWGILAFPKIPEDYLERFENDEIINTNLIFPTKANKQLPNNEDNYWGCFYDNAGNSWVQKCSVWFPCNENDFRELGNDISKITKQYIDKFILFLEILSENTFEQNLDNISVNENLTQYWFLKEGNIYNAEKPKFTLNITIINNQIFISKDIIEKSLNFSNQGFEPKLQYKLFRDAIFHKNNNDYRRAIIDIATVIEIVFTGEIIKEFAKIKIKEQNLIKSVLKKYHSLSGRIELLSTMNINMPRHKNDYIKCINEIRNKSVHSGYNPNKNEIKNALDITKVTLKHFCEEIYIIKKTSDVITTPDAL